MSNTLTNQTVQEQLLATNAPLSLTAEEIDHPETVLIKFCEDNYLDRMKTIFWEVVAIAASVDYDHIDEFTPREMLAFHNKVDRFLEAVYIIVPRYEGRKKDRKRGAVDISNLPKRLTDEQIDHPESVIAELFKDSSLEDIRAIMKDIVIQAVCSDDLGMTNLHRRDMIWFCEQIETLIEAVYILNPQPSTPNRKD